MAFGSLSIALTLLLDLNRLHLGLSLSTLHLRLPITLGRPASSSNKTRHNSKKQSTLHVSVHKRYIPRIHDSVGQLVVRNTSAIQGCSDQ